MANVHRTPPPKLQNLAQTQSEPDISAAIDSDMSEHVTNRYKRPRKDNSPTVGPTFGNQDLTDMAKMANLLESQTALIQKLVTDVNEIKAQNVKIQESNTEIRKANEEIERSMQHFNQKFEEMRIEVEDLKKERKEQVCYIQSLENKIIDLQYLSRSSCIEIRNIPQTDSETAATLSTTLRNIGQLVGAPISEQEIRDIYRQPGKPSQTPITRPIIAEFTKVNTKQNLLSAIRTYNKTKNSNENKLNTELIGIAGGRQPVYVADRLPTSSRKLFYLARQFAKDNQYTFCWINNGNIFLRKRAGDKQILIRSEKCLKDLGNNVPNPNI